MEQQKQIIKDTTIEIQGDDKQQQDNNTFVCDVEEILENSFFNKDSLQLGYALTLIEPIRNDTITDIYK